MAVYRNDQTGPKSLSGGFHFGFFSVCMQSEAQSQAWGRQSLALF